MHIEPAVDLIKNGGGKDPRTQATLESSAGPNRWSTAVQSWVAEFQQHSREESLPAFDSLFKDAPPR
jgi:hypothetical protein